MTVSKYRLPFWFKKVGFDRLYWLLESVEIDLWSLQVGGIELPGGAQKNSTNHYKADFASIWNRIGETKNHYAPTTKEKVPRGPSWPPWLPVSMVNESDPLTRCFTATVWIVTGNNWKVYREEGETAIHSLIVINQRRKKNRKRARLVKYPGRTVGKADKGINNCILSGFRHPERNPGEIRLIPSIWGECRLVTSRLKS
jgi:hypothetical protein